MSSVNLNIVGSRKFLEKCTERDLLFIMVIVYLAQISGDIVQSKREPRAVD